MPEVIAVPESLDMLLRQFLGGDPAVCERNTFLNVLVPEEAPQKLVLRRARTDPMAGLSHEASDAADDLRESLEITDEPRFDLDEAVLSFMPPPPPFEYSERLDTYDAFEDQQTLPVLISSMMPCKIDFTRSVYLSERESKAEAVLLDVVGEVAPPPNVLQKLGLMELPETPMALDQECELPLLLPPPPPPFECERFETYDAFEDQQPAHVSFAPMLPSKVDIVESMPPPEGVSEPEACQPPGMTGMLPSKVDIVESMPPPEGVSETEEVFELAGEAAGPGLERTMLPLNDLIEGPGMFEGFEIDEMGMPFPPPPPPFDCERFETYDDFEGSMPFAPMMSCEVDTMERAEIPPSPGTVEPWNAVGAFALATPMAHMGMFLPPPPPVAAPLKAHMGMFLPPPPPVAAPLMEEPSCPAPPSAPPRMDDVDAENPEELPQPLSGQILTRTLSSNGSLRIRWAVDARKLESQDKQAISPEFSIDFPNHGPEPFRVAIYPNVVKDGKRGAGFKKAKGKGKMVLKCEAELPKDVPDIFFRLGVGVGIKRQPFRGPVSHNFSEQNCCGLPAAEAEWDFMSAVDDSKFCVVTLEIAPLLAAA